MESSLEATLSQPETAVRHRTMAEAALERLREAIILGELTPGTPLRLEDLARSLGTSISPIREAVRQLEALGLAEHVPHHGAKVVALDDRGAARALLHPARARDDGGAARRRAVRRGGRGGGPRAPRRARPGARSRRRARGGAGAHGLPLRAVRSRAFPVAAAPDPARVGQLRALPAGAARRRRDYRSGTRRSTTSCSTRARRTIPTAPPRRCTTTSSWRPRSTKSSSAAEHLRVLALQETARAGDGALCERRLEQLLRDERAGSGAETRAGPRARADLPQPLDRRRVARAASRTGARGSSGRARASRRRGRRAAG